MLRLFNLGASAEARNGNGSLNPSSEEAALLDALSDGVLTADEADRVSYANRAAIELFGRERNALVGEQLLNLFTRDSRDAVRFGQSAARGGLPQRYDADIAGMDECKVSVSAAPLGGANTPAGTVLTLRDVTDMRRAHQELARSELRYRHLFEDASDAIMTFDSLGRFTSVNDAGERISGYSRDELIGRFFGPLLPLTELPRAVIEFRKALSGQPGQFESIVVRKDGERRHITITYSCPQRSREVLCLIRDATEEKQLQQQLMQSEKMGAIGQLVSGVAHELNNPLASITAFAKLMLSDGNLTAEDRHATEVIASESRRAARIVHNLLTFARQHRAEKTYADINQVIENTLELRGYDLSVRGIQIERSFADPGPSTMVDAYQLQQVILNLVTNAEQAMASLERPHHRLAVRTRCEAETIRIEVEDTGPGIPVDSLERIFNPFYTTKAVGHGTGLGLSISLGIISEHGGRIWVENVTSGGGGARFCVDLPRVAPSPGSAATMVSAPHTLPEGLRILVADDEAPIRLALTRFLEKAGHLVVAVDSGGGALAAARDKTFDAVLLDMRMPDISGKSVFEQWQTERPELARRVVFLTGDIVSADLQQFFASTGQTFLAKPFDLDIVLQLLQPMRR
ncbi:MAG TPA: PAS domain S-box protein [Gemmatimonadaceae bacterium]|nr:PAS domain S-box protein [Gemmatimonadaceae bacterium]